MIYVRRICLHSNDPFLWEKLECTEKCRGMTSSMREERHERLESGQCNERRSMTAWQRMQREHGRGHDSKCPFRTDEELLQVETGCILAE